MTHFARLCAALDALDPAELATLRTFVLECHGTLYICGNGGSYAVALHWACDLEKAGHRRVAVLGANGSLVTAYANDDGYHQTYARELARHAQPGDRLVCLSCSGTSPNIRAAMRMTESLGLRAALVTSDVCEAPAMLKVRSREYGVIEDVFAAIGHWLTGEMAS